MDASIVVFVLFLQYCNKGYLLNWEDTAELKGLCISINTCAAGALGILASTYTSVSFKFSGTIGAKVYFKIPIFA